MDTEISSGTVTSRTESSSSQEDLDISTGECTCADDHKSCVFCAVKQCKEEWQKVKNLSKEYSLRREKKNKKREKNIAVYRNNKRRRTNIKRRDAQARKWRSELHQIKIVDCRSEVQQINNFAANLQQVQTTSNTDCEQVESDGAAVRQTETCQTEVQSCETQLQQSQNCHNQVPEFGADLQQVEKLPNVQICGTESQHCHDDLQQIQTDDAKSNRVQNCDTNVQQAEDCGTNLPQVQNCDTNFRVIGNVDSNLQLIRYRDSFLKKIQNCEAKLMLIEKFRRNFQQSENSDATLDLSQNCSTDAERNQNCHLNFLQTQNLQQVQNSDTNFQQAENADNSFQQSRYRERILKKIQDCKSKLELIEQYRANLKQSKNSDASLELNLNSNTDEQDSRNSCLNFQQDQKCGQDVQLEDTIYIKSEIIEFDSEPLSDTDTDSKPLCDDLEHSQQCYRDPPLNDFPKIEIKSEMPDPDICAQADNQDFKRSRRNSKRKRDLEDSCPVCGLTVRCSELENHFAKEVENLSHIGKSIGKPRMATREKEGVKLTFVQVKCNRENRLAAKVAKYTKKNEVQCPICHVKLTGSEADANEHVLNCAEEDYESDVNVTDHDHGDSFAEYEFAGETRVRAIDLVPGGYRSLHGYSFRSRHEDEEESDLNVDIDDTMAYGKPQYSELDVIHNTRSAAEVKEIEQLRRAVICDPDAEPHVIEGNKWSQDSEIANEVAFISGSNNKSASTSNENKGNNVKDEENLQKVESDIISSLKERIKDLEQQKNVKCLVCLEPYTKPVVSTTCWHVHCEECWLVTMGVKKLCPQCNTIVSPTSLRKIFL